MNCMEFEGVVVDIARGELMDAAARREGLAHAAGCGRCGRRLANEQFASSIVATAAAEYAVLAAPPKVEKALLAAFRERQMILPRHSRVWLDWRVGAAIAAMLIVVVMAALRKPESPGPVGVKSVPRNTVPAPVKVLAPVYREPSKPPVRTLRAARHKAIVPSRVEAQRETREVVTDFIPVDYDPEPVEHGRMVRVRLPRSALAAFGLPVNEQLAEEAIQADVVLGEDGLARAVRFVQ
jgi:hypothetical protein